MTNPKLFTKNIHYNLDVERAVLGVTLIEKYAFGKIIGAIEAESFYNQYHKQLFSTIHAMYVNGIPIDVLTVIDQIARVQGKPNLGNDNTNYFIHHLTQDVVSGAHIEYHAFLIKTMWMEREIIRLTNGPRLDGDVRQKITILTEQLQSIQAKAIEHDWQDMTHLMVEMYQHQQHMQTSGGVGIPSGIKELDQQNGGFHAGQLVVIGARPSVGKSALVGSIALDMARLNYKVGIISLEMSNTEIAARLAALDTDTNFNILYRGLYADEVQSHAIYRQIGKTTSNLPIYVTDKTGVNIIEIKAKAEKLKSLYGLDCLIIDYLQLIDTPEQYNRTRENEIAKMSRYCKIMAKDMNIPVILLCQLNREVTKRKGQQRYPQLSDLRESGSIEQDADIVLFLHRDWMNGDLIDENGASTELQADLIVRKWRNGKNNFIVPLDFDPPKMKFTSRAAVTGWRSVQE